MNKDERIAQIKRQITDCRYEAKSRKEDIEAANRQITALQGKVIIRDRQLTDINKNIDRLTKELKKLEKGK